MRFKRRIGPDRSGACPGPGTARVPLDHRPCGPSGLARYPGGDARQPPTQEEGTAQGRNAFGAGALLSLSNPKNIVFWGAQQCAGGIVEGTPSQAQMVVFLPASCPPRCSGVHLRGAGGPAAPPHPLPLWQRIAGGLWRVADAGRLICAALEAGQTKAPGPGAGAWVLRGQPALGFHRFAASTAFPARLVRHGGHPSSRRS